MNEDLFQSLPSVNELLSNPAIVELQQQFGSGLVKQQIQQVLNNKRQQIIQGEKPTLATTDLVVAVKQQIHDKTVMSLRPVINATGVVLHTNLGRSLLSPEIKQAVNEVGFQYSNLEYNLNEKARGQRYSHVEALIRDLTGAEDALVVNNNAAAVMLVLDTLVNQKEVIVSRGELVEIGGSFRIPEIITSGGGILHEIGTTNKTHLVDYQRALSDETGAILKVHTSNYRIVGFTESVASQDLSKLAHEAQVPLIYDLGSGLLVDLSKFGLPAEPLIKEELKWYDLVTFSGDKLLGGPQAGIIAGKRDYIERLKHNQLLRALRVDKLTLAALEATLHLYENPEKVIQKIPTLRMITLPLAELQQHAQRLSSALKQIKSLKVTTLAGTSQVGGGSYPGYLLPTELVAVTPTTISATKLESKLRISDSPIIVRLEKGQVQFDVRTLQIGDDEKIVRRISQLMRS
ncbi:L-seryl-tRNA(Sec) selenium transferase [Loigolactobacillus backii]|uniref:L-seryl-tRNA(Sec) selenium transferase n=1 Tax=Loigolactobacillus backii TaxID=375175 RepID=A0A192H222_9LACO|nr:L-seryl-tRNA(Sec) selenium transferase [Loigolactobacillus backii]ANK61996.1 L-selenocysteinyl-tRNA(Sec) synthase [Loigolactobacillus backii]ANK65387.1 L-selenocysteinyl-tRNA(Sec) synthase [Loigolactobacillus backii]ANK68810.1 L-selenocysteinyl-tRNA(Sec) synthase [Loigolactobacillus backii]MDA5386808.1 L-seryl-tRNA(Sec) selenium transferase [Loigolactobacillus backii]MDA5389407.1 L-seryl-tRNA(Sec) selenium transferase [Loigolactobacillus backii]